MNRVAAIGTALAFSKGYGQFFSGHIYAIVGLHTDHLQLVEIDLKKRSAAKNLHNLDRGILSSLEGDGYFELVPLPPIPQSSATIQVDGHETNVNVQGTISWAKKLRPMIDAAQVIFSAKDPIKAFNKMARLQQLHQSRARERFFWLAAFGFDEDCLAPAYWNSGISTPNKSAVNPQAKRGRKIKDPSVTPTGWVFDQDWEKPIFDGWRKHAKLRKLYIDIYIDTLRTEFGCSIDRSCWPARICHPEGKTFPKYTQFRNFILKSNGEYAWLAAKYGEQTIRNRAGNSIEKVGQYLINLLEEVQWDGQILDERPGDVRDPTTPGKAIVRVVATCCTCGGPVGVGYDYGAESKWGYLMALLCMAMKKSEFCALFGVEISDEDWPAIGIMLSIRGDRGPAIGRKISDIIANVLKIWQEWAPSYDPVGKPNAESGHHKTVKIEGAPIRQSHYRTVSEIIRDDLRKTVAKFRSADMSHRLDPDQAKRLDAGTPLMIWNDLVNRRLYAGQFIAIEKLIRHTLPRHEVTIYHDGVELGGVRYLSTELIQSGILERARGQAIAGHAYAPHLTVKCIWLDINNSLMCLTGVPVRINAMDATHSLTLEESMFYLEKMNRSRRAVEEDQKALRLANEIESEKERRAIEDARQKLPPYKSEGKKQTADQHERIFKRKK